LLGGKSENVEINNGLELFCEVEVGQIKFKSLFSSR
jgi:hypothetical protein